MHYYIDGYNFLFKIYEEVDPLKEKREEIIADLQEKLVSLGMKMTIVFDSLHTQGAFFPTRFTKSCLEIIYTPSKQSADQYLLEMLQCSKNNGIKTIVTSDRFLAKQAKILGAQTVSIAAFLKLLLKKEENQFKEEKKFEGECSREFERLLKAFQRKLHDDFS